MTVIFSVCVLALLIDVPISQTIRYSCQSTYQFLILNSNLLLSFDRLLVSVNISCSRSKKDVRREIILFVVVVMKVAVVAVVVVVAV